jgi:hypothetical protein
VTTPPAVTGHGERRDDLLIRASLALTGVSFLCIIAGLATADLDLDDFGLISSFSPIFLLGLVLLPLASSLLWFIDRRLDGIVIGQLVLLITALWLSPYVLESTARFRSGYKNFAAVDWLLRGDAFDTHDVIYHNWPLFPSAMAGLIELLPVSGEHLMGFFPYAISISYIVPLVVLLRIFHASGARWWSGVWFFYLFNWSGQDYFSPQALAFFFYLCIVALLAFIAARREGEVGVVSTAFALLLYGAIVLTHLLTALIVVAIIAALSFGRQLRHWPLLIAALIMLAAWQLYGAFAFFDSSHDRLLESLLSPQDFFNLNIGGRLAGTPEHSLVGRARMVTTLVAFALAGLGLVVWARDRGLADRKILRLSRGLRGPFVPETNNDTDRPPAAPAVIFAVPSLLGLAILAPMYAYGGEMLIRVVLFSLPILAILTAIAMSWRPAVVVVVITFAAMAPLHLVTHYGNEAYDYVSPKELDGFRLVSEDLAPANIYGGYPAGSYNNTKLLDWRFSVRPGKNKPPDIEGYLNPQTHSWRHQDWPIFVALSRGDGAAARLFYNDPDFLLKARSEIEDRCNFHLVFDNGDFILYRWLPDCGSDNSPGLEFPLGGLTFP